MRIVKYSLLKICAFFIFRVVKQVTGRVCQNIRSPGVGVAGWTRNQDRKPGPETRTRNQDRKVSINL